MLARAAEVSPIALSFGRVAVDSSNKYTVSPLFFGKGTERNRINQPTSIHNRVRDFAKLISVR